MYIIKCNNITKKKGCKAPFNVLSSSPNLITFLTLKITKLMYVHKKLDWFLHYSSINSLPKFKALQITLQHFPPPPRFTETDKNR